MTRPGTFPCFFAFRIWKRIKDGETWKAFGQTAFSYSVRYFTTVNTTIYKKSDLQDSYSQKTGWRQSHVWSNLVAQGALRCETNFNVFKGIKKLLLRILSPPTFALSTPFMQAQQVVALTRPQLVKTAKVSLEASSGHWSLGGLLSLSCLINLLTANSSGILYM